MIFPPKKTNPVDASKAEASKVEELTAPEVVPNAKPAPQEKIKTEKKIEECIVADKMFEELAKKRGYIKKPSDEQPSIIQFKIAWFTFLSLVIGDIIYFLSNAIENGQWHFTAPLWQFLLISVIKDAGAILIGKILKYYNAKADFKDMP